MKTYKSQTVEYQTWVRMIKRCHDTTDDRYYDYGGRGIKVCVRWKNSFDNFLSDMGIRPQNKKSLDRRNNNKGYSPENCRWADDFEQANNRRDNINVEIDGITKTVSEWCLHYSLKVSSVFDRINKRRWDPKEAIVRPFLKARTVCIDGIYKTVPQWSKKYNIHPQSVNRCIRKGMSPEQSIQHVRRTSWKKQI